MRDAQPSSGVSPGERLVGRPVVREHPCDGHTAVGEPRDGALEHSDRGDGLLVGAALDAGNTRVVINDGVEERGPDVGFVAPPFPGALRRGFAVPVALLLADVSPSAAVRNVAELRDVDVQG